MEVRGICFGNEIGGRAFLASTDTNMVELCFEDHQMKKDGLESLYVLVIQYMECEDIIVAERPMFGAYVDSDNDHDDEYVNAATLERYGDEFGEGYHNDIKTLIEKSVFTHEISLARHVMDLFINGKLNDIGSFYGKEADGISIPDVQFDIKEN